MSNYIIFSICFFSFLLSHITPKIKPKNTPNISGKEDLIMFIIPMIMIDNLRIFFVSFPILLGNFSQMLNIVPHQNGGKSSLQLYKTHESFKYQYLKL